MTSRDDTVAAAVLLRSDEAAQLLSAAIRAASVTGEEAPFAGWVESWAQARGWHTERQQLGDTRFDGLERIAEEERRRDRFNLLVRPRPRTARPLVVFNGHLDVVPAGDPDAWTGTPFDGVIADGKIHGRGAVDTKGGIVATLVALDTVLQCAQELAVDIELHLVVGEERSGIGTRAALAGFEAPDAAVVLEATGGRIVTASTGLIAFEITTFGRAAHSSKPWEGADALDHLLRIRTALLEREEVRNASWRRDEFADLPMPLPFVVGTLNAGTYRNTVPDHAVLAGRVGLAPGMQSADSVAELIDLVRGVDQEARWTDPSQVHVLHHLAGWRTDANHWLVNGLRDAIPQPEERELLALTAGSDAGYYGQAGVPTVMLGPGSMAMAHSPNESLGVVELSTTAALIARALQTWRPQ